MYIQWRAACETYREAIATWKEYQEKEVECDRLQRIHTLQNLAWLVEEGRSGGIHSLQDDSLKERVREGEGKGEGEGEGGRRRRGSRGRGSRGRGGERKRE